VTFEFTFEDVRSKTQGSGCFSVLKCNGQSLCNMEEWLFRSCAVHGLSNFSVYYHPDVPWSTELVDALIEWFKTMKGAEGGWAWREALFCVTEYQRGPLLALIEHSNVKLIDRFTNKAHGDTPMFLYRLSVEKDFKRVNKN
jgi:hypothetical protein